MEEECLLRDLESEMNYIRTCSTIDIMNRTFGVSNYMMPLRDEE